MDHVKRLDADTSSLRPVLNSLKVKESYFDTSYVGRPSDVFAYWMVDNPYVHSEMIESNSKLYNRMRLMDESRQDYSAWKVKIHDPGKTGDGRLNPDIRVSLHKRYGRPVKGSTLQQAEHRRGLFKIEGALDPDETSIEELETILS